MINNIETIRDSNHKQYPIKIKWTFNGIPCSVEVGGYEQKREIMNKLIDAQTRDRKLTTTKIRYVRAKR